MDAVTVYREAARLILFMIIEALAMAECTKG